MNIDNINDVMNYFKQLANKVIQDTITLTVAVIIALLILSLIFTWLEWKGKT